MTNFPIDEIPPEVDDPSLKLLTLEDVLSTASNAEVMKALAEQVIDEDKALFYKKGAGIGQFVIYKGMPSTGKSTLWLNETIASF